MDIIDVALVGTQRLLIMAPTISGRHLCTVKHYSMALSTKQVNAILRHFISPEKSKEDIIVIN